MVCLISHLIFCIITLIFVIFNSKTGPNSCGFEQLYLRANNLRYIIFKRTISKVSGNKNHQNMKIQCIKNAQITFLWIINWEVFTKP